MSGSKKTKDSKKSYFLYFFLQFFNEQFNTSKNLFLKISSQFGFNEIFKIPFLRFVLKKVDTIFCRARSRAWAGHEEAGVQGPELARPQDQVQGRNTLQAQGNQHQRAIPGNKKGFYQFRVSNYWNDLSNFDSKSKLKYYIK